MIELTKYPLIQQAQDQPVKKMVDLVAVSNLEVDDSLNLDTTIHAIDNNLNTLSVEGNCLLIFDKWAIIGHEVIFLENPTFDGTYTTYDISRENYGTKIDDIDLTGFNIRTVVLFPTKVKDFSIDESKGNQGLPFTYSKEDGFVEIFDSVANWSNTSPTYKYRLRRKKSAVYLFIGFMGERLLKNVMFAYQSYRRTPSSSANEHIRINFYSKWFIWEDIKIKERKQFKNIYPKQLFSQLLDYNEDMIYYANGNIETDFITTNNLFTKDYEKYGDLFKDIISGGLYCYWDELERLKITTTLTVENIVPSTPEPIDNRNINDIQGKDDDKLIINTVIGEYYDRKTLFDFDSLNNKYVDYRSVIINSSFQLLSYNVTNDTYDIQIKTINSLDMYTSTKIGDIVIIKDRLNGLEFHGKTLNYSKVGTSHFVDIAFINYDKDYIWYARGGKLDYLVSLGYDSSRQFDIYYDSVSLPTIYKHQRNLESGIASSNLRIALLPQVTDISETNILSTECKFGSPQNLEVGEYSGEYEEIDGIYGTFGQAELPYNRTIEQFENAGLPPLFLMSNTITTNITRGDDKFLNFNTYDNRDIQVIISNSEETDNNAKIEYKNLKEITSSQILTINPTAFSEAGNITIQIDQTTYLASSIGDVLTVKQPTDFGGDITLENLYENTKALTWVVNSLFENGGNYYMVVDNPIPKEFDLLKYPWNSIVFLQEFFIKGNPIIQTKQPITEVNTESVEEYGEKEVTVNGKLWDNLSFRKIADFYKNGFSAVQPDYSDVREIRPVKIVNYIELQKYDIVTIRDTKYTGVDETTEWMFLGATYGSANHGNEVACKLMNINKISADPLNITLPSTLKFQPITDPEYNHQGNEGLATEVQEDLNNKITAVGDDNIFGRIAYSEIPYSDLSAKVKSFDETTLIMDNVVIGNSSYNTMLSTVGNTILFKIEEELITGIVSDWNGTDSTITVLKRQVCSSPLADITVGKNVQFQTIISGTIDGKLLSTSLDVGNDQTYMRFDVDNGVQIQGAVEITSGNTYDDIQDAQDTADQAIDDASDAQNTANSAQSTANNAQTTADGKNTIYRQASTPTGSHRVGDIWKDSDNSFLKYEWNGSSWVEVGESYSGTSVKLGSGAVSDVFPIKDGFRVSGNASNSMIFNTTDSEFTLVTDGNILINNDFNKLYFGGIGALNASQLLMNVSNSFDGYYGDFSMHIGDKSSEHIAFNTNIGEFDIKLKQISMIQTTTGSDNNPFMIIENVGNEVISEFRSGGTNIGSPNGQSVYFGINAGKKAIGSYQANIAIGTNALSNSNSTTESCVVGVSAMSNATGDYNSVFGWNAMGIGVGSGSNNCVFGHRAMRLNTFGNSNVSMGVSALTDNTVGNENVSIGSNSMANNKSGDFNVAIGAGALLFATTATDRATCIGYEAGKDIGLGGYNVTCIGNNAQPSTPTVSNEVTIGDDNVTKTRLKGTIQTLGTYANITPDASNVVVLANGELARSTSALKYKKDIEDLSLDDSKIIYDMRPVIYNSACDGNINPQYKHAGVIADEVDALGDAGKRLVTYNNDEVEGFKYERLPVYLLKELQEQKKTIDNQQKQIEELKEMVNQLLNK